MVEKMQHFDPRVGQVDPQKRQSHVPAKQGAASFQQELEKEISRSEDLKFSIHAQERIRLRGIPISQFEMNRLKQGVNQIADKGGRESVVLMDDSAFLVSVRNRTVITAMGQDQLKNNVFTNIDSAIIV